jgi:hypothetical protein
VLAPCREVQQRFRRAVPALDLPFDQKLADHLGTRRAARLACRGDNVAATLEPRSEPTDLGRLAGTLA